MYQIIDFYTMVNGKYYCYYFNTAKREIKEILYREIPIFMDDSLLDDVNLIPNRCS